MVHAPQGQGIGALRGLTLALLAIVISRSSVMARDWKSLIAKHSFNNTFTSRNTTLPYSLEELGLSPSRLMTLHGNATWHPQRRLLGQLGVCRARKNINFAGGGLEGGGLRMANVKSRKISTTKNVPVSVAWRPVFNEDLHFSRCSCCMLQSMPANDRMWSLELVK